VKPEIGGDVEIDVEKLKADWVGKEFDEKTFEIRQEAALEFARACGETAPRFVDPEHPDFQAPVTITAQFTGGRIFPEELTPVLRRGGGGFDAGKRVQPLGPIRPGDRLVGRSQIHDVYEKTGRSGSMLFIVHRMTFSNQRGEPVSIVDWRMVSRSAGA
jgi:hypothetical protein